MKRLLPKALKGLITELVVNGVKRKFPKIIGKLQLSTPDVEKAMKRNYFIGDYLMTPGLGNEAFADETIRRLSTYFTPEEVEYIKTHPEKFPLHPFETIKKAAKKPVILGSFIDKDSKVLGFFDRKTNQAFVTYKDTPSTTFHENNMHGTDEVIEAFVPDVVKDYQSFADNIFNNTHTVDGYTYPFKEENFVEGGFRGHKLTPASKRAREVRATFGQAIRKLYYEAAHKKGYQGISGHIEELRPDVEKYIDSLNELELADLLGGINAYGDDYATFGPKVYPDFLTHGKRLLKYAPLTIMLYDKNNK